MQARLGQQAFQFMQVLDIRAVLCNQRRLDAVRSRPAIAFRGSHPHLRHNTTHTLGRKLGELYLMQQKLLLGGHFWVIDKGMLVIMM